MWILQWYTYGMTTIQSFNKYTWIVWNIMVNAWSWSLIRCIMHCSSSGATIANLIYLCCEAQDTCLVGVSNLRETDGTDYNGLSRKIGILELRGSWDCRSLPQSSDSGAVACHWQLILWMTKHHHTQTVVIPGKGQKWNIPHAPWTHPNGRCLSVWCFDGWILLPWQFACRSIQLHKHYGQAFQKIPRRREKKWQLKCVTLACVRTSSVGK